MDWTRNPANGLAVPWVRIPPFPLSSQIFHSIEKSGLIFAYFLRDFSKQMKRTPVITKEKREKNLIFVNVGLIDVSSTLLFLFGRSLSNGGQMLPRITFLDHSFQANVRSIPP